MRRFVVTLLAVFSVMLISCGESKTPSELDLDTAKAATEQFQTVESAVAAGYLPTEECVASPDGTMGMHYVNPGLIADGVLDVEKPEILLYVPGDSGPKLVGIEFLSPIGPPGAPIPSPAPPAPSLFGETFNGPMEGHGEGPPHFDLHVWTFQETPPECSRIGTPLLAARNPEVNTARPGENERRTALHSGGLFAFSRSLGTHRVYVSQQGFDCAGAHVSAPHRNQRNEHTNSSASAFGLGAVS